MNFFLRCLLNSLLAAAAILSAAVYADPIEFVYRPAWKTENYLTFLLSKIPMNQYKAIANETVQVTGQVLITFKNVPEKLKVELTSEVSRAFKGERPVSGAFLEASGAQLVFVGDALPYVEPEQKPMTMEELGFTYSPVDEEAIQREVEERQRWADMQLGNTHGCGHFLGHIEK